MRPFLIIFLLIFLALPSSGQDFDKGMDAFRRHDFQSAMREWRPLAADGHAGAQFQIGNLYEYGRGVQQSDAETIRNYASAATLGHASAQYRLGILYDNGWGVIRNDIEAVRWYRKAAEAGHDYAQFDLALMYADGTGVNRDYVQAYVWMSKAIAQGNDHMIKHRRRLARNMTSDQRAQAQRLADR